MAKTAILSGPFATTGLGGEDPATGFGEAQARASGSGAPG